MKQKNSEQEIFFKGVILSLEFAVLSGCGVSGGPSINTVHSVNYSGAYEYVDNNGNVYIADSSNHVIRKISALGQITTVTGVMSASGTSGDNGPATSAKLNFPTDVLVDSTGNILYIADDDNNAIRKVDLTTGMITTVAGIIGTSGYSGDGGLATAAKLASPYFVGLDRTGNLYIADVGNCVVRKVDANTKIITTIAGNQASCSSNPPPSGDNVPAVNAVLSNYFSMLVDVNGNIYLGEYSGSAIRKISAATGMINTLAGTLNSPGNPIDGSLARNALLSYPAIGSVDIYGNYYILDVSTIRRVDGETGVITTVGGTNGTTGDSGNGGLAINALFNYPNKTALDASNNIYIPDTGSCTIRKILASNQNVELIAGTSGICTGTGDGGLAIHATLNEPFDFTY